MMYLTKLQPPKLSINLDCQFVDLSLQKKAVQVRLRRQSERLWYDNEGNQHDNFTTESRSEGESSSE